MTITIHSTTKLVTVNKLLCQLWEGVTAKGIPIHAFIPRIGVAPDQDLSEFATELQEQQAPSPEVAAIPDTLEL